MVTKAKDPFRLIFMDKAVRETGTQLVKRGLAEMLKGGVIMDVVDAEQARIAEDAGAAAVMALERVPSDIRKDGGVARMSNPEMIEGIKSAVTIPVMAKARIGHFAEAQILQSLEVDYVDESEVLTDGFHLLIDALKLNNVETIYGVPGIPITDFGRMAQASGIRVLSFRHEQNAGNAAAIAGYLTKKPGVCLTVSAPGFLNGLTALAHASTNCWPMILISGSSEREIVDLMQGDYEEMDQLAIAKPLCKAAYRILNAEDIGIGVARAI